MPVPKFRTSHSKKNMRRSHHFLTVNGLSYCSNCNAVCKPHHVCSSCGFYKDKQVMAVKKSNLPQDSFEIPK